MISIILIVQQERSTQQMSLINLRRDIVKKNDFIEGDKVTYISHNKKEHGIVKWFPDNKHAFVVYHCDNNWNNYKEYTAARTETNDLEHGWI